MNTIKVLSISNVSIFLQVIDRCTGTVLLDVPDVGLCDLKENAVARGMLISKKCPSPHPY